MARYEELYSNDGYDFKEGTTGRTFFDTDTGDVEHGETYDGTTWIYRFSPDGLDVANDYDLAAVARAHGMEPEALREIFRSKDPKVRAHGWVLVGGHYGFGELDPYPLAL